jgi:hypothetical protein
LVTLTTNEDEAHAAILAPVMRSDSEVMVVLFVGLHNWIPLGTLSNVRG